MWGEDTCKQVFPFDSILDLLALFKVHGRTDSGLCSQEKFEDSSILGEKVGSQIFWLAAQLGEGQTGFGSKMRMGKGNPGWGCKMQKRSKSSSP